MRRNPVTAVLVMLVLVLALSACTPQQITDWFAARGHTVSPAVAQALSTYAGSEAARNQRADWAARNSGARGTCSPTGIFYAESGGNWTAQNRSSSASGGFQFIDGTWANHRGYARALYAPPWVQWEKFLQVWAGGAGRSHWAASVC